jgi:hypothetical protein
VKPLRIYIAGPYQAPSAVHRQANVNKAIDAALRLLKKGHLPFVPHLTHFVDVRASELGTPLQWEDYISWDLAWLEVADALLLLGRSRGADIEYERAKKLGKIIFHSIDEVPNAESHS